MLKIIRINSKWWLYLLVILVISVIWLSCLAILKIDLHFQTIVVVDHQNYNLLVRRKDIFYIYHQNSLIINFENQNYIFNIKKIRFDVAQNVYVIEGQTSWQLIPYTTLAVSVIYKQIKLIDFFIH